RLRPAGAAPRVRPQRAPVRRKDRRLVGRRRVAGAARHDARGGVGQPVGRAERRSAARRPVARGLVVHPEPPEVIVSEPPRIARAAWAVVGLLWVVALLNYFDRQLVTT